MEDYCKLCKVFLPGKTSIKDHFTGKRHQSNLKSQCKIEHEFFVTNMTNSAKRHQILSLFATYGEVDQCFISKDKEYIIIRFKNASKLLEQKVVFENNDLEIKRVYDLVPRKDTFKAPPPPKSNADEVLLNQLKNGVDFNSQLTFLLHYLQPNWNAYIQARHKLYADLQHSLKAIFREYTKCIVHPFGSTVTGLGFDSSDVDIYVELVNDRGIKCKDPLTCIKRSKSLAYRSKGLFKDVFPIPKAKTPIIKCVHASTGINCDFNFKNMLGVCNSFLIKYYIGLHPRLHQIMMVIKYWAKVHEFTGTGRISNYALIILLIAYLQQSYNFPSVHHLQSLNSPINMQEGWNGGFASMFFDPIDLKSTSIIQFLQGFFQFYARFDYSLKIVCPFLGCALVKSDFFNIETVPDQFALYINNLNSGQLPLKMNTVMCVQDPFEHNHNVTAGVSLKLLENFTERCREACDILKDPIDKNIIPNLLKVPDLIQYVVDRQTITIPLGNCLSYLEQLNPTNVENCSEDKLEQFRHTFYDVVNDYIVVVLNDIIHCSVALEEEKDRAENSQKIEKVSGQSDPYDVDVVNVRVYHCKGKYNTWISRNFVTRAITVHGPSSSLDTEVAYSNYIVNVMQDIIKTNDDIVKFTVHVENKVNPTRVALLFKNQHSNSKDFHTMAQFLLKKLPHMFEKHTMECGKKKIVTEEKENVNTIRKGFDNKIQLKEESTREINEESTNQTEIKTDKILTDVVE